MRGWCLPPAILMWVAGCLQPEAVTCESWVCPAGNVCDVVHQGCVKPSQLRGCENKVDGDPCDIDSPDDGVCDQTVCLVERCGDGYIRGGEQCDGNTIPAGADCTDLNFYVSRTPTCTADCTFDLSSCEQRCGDGVFQPEFEICESDTEITASCVDYGFGAGNLGCINCGPDTSRCVPFGWQRSNAPGGFVALSGASATDVHAVLAGRTLAHFDGITWTEVDTTGCGLTPSQGLLDVVVPEPGVVFARADDAVIRLMGATCTKWAVGSNNILTMWAISATEAWVSVSDDGVYRFDGSTWTRKIALTGNDNAGAVWGSSANNVYIVDYDGEVRIYNGTSFGSPAVPTGMDIVQTVWGTSASDVYAGGLDLNGAAKIVHWNGTQWTPVLANHPSLAGTSPRISRGIKAGGRSYVLAGTLTPPRRVVLVNDGGGWFDLDAPVMFDVPMWVASTGEVFVGLQGAMQAAIMRGSARFDSSSTLGSHVGSLAARGPDDVYAVPANSGTLRRWDGADWSAPLAPTNVSAVDVAPNGTVYAVGPTGLSFQTQPGGSWTSATNVSGDYVFALADTDVWVLSTTFNFEALYRYHSPSSADTLNYPRPNLEVMRGAWGLAANDMFLVGGTSSNGPAIYHYDGVSFQSGSAT